MTGPSGPPTSTVWLIFVFAPAGSIRQLKRNFVPGTTLVTRAKPRPGCTSTSCMLWCWPAFVFITPVDPETKPPCQSIVETLGFHSPQVDISDQICQTLSGDAVVSTEVPYSRAIPLPPQLSASLSVLVAETSATLSFVRLRRTMTPIRRAVPTSCTP